MQVEWEIGTATYSSLLLQISEHDNNGCFLFPDHPPKVKNGMCYWAYIGKSDLKKDKQKIYYKHAFFAQRTKLELLMFTINRPINSKIVDEFSNEKYW